MLMFWRKLTERTGIGILEGSNISLRSKYLDINKLKKDMFADSKPPNQIHCPQSHIWMMMVWCCHLKNVLKVKSHLQTLCFHQHKIRATLRSVSWIKLWKCMYFPFDCVTCSYDGTTKPVRGMKRLLFFPFFASRYVSAGFNPLERIKHQKTVLSKRKYTHKA